MKRLIALIQKTWATSIPKYIGGALVFFVPTYLTLLSVDPITLTERHNRYVTMLAPDLLVTFAKGEYGLRAAALLFCLAFCYLWFILYELDKKASAITNAWRQQQLWSLAQFIWRNSNHADNSFNSYPGKTGIFKDELDSLDERMQNLFETFDDATELYNSLENPSKSSLPKRPDFNDPDQEINWYEHRKRIKKYEVVVDTLRERDNELMKQWAKKK